MTSASGDTWMTGAAYEAYMGALTSTICSLCEPALVIACDTSA